MTKKQKAWVITVVKIDDINDKKYEQIGVLCVLSPRLIVRQVQSQIEILYNIFFRDLKSQLKQFGYKKKEVIFSNLRVGYLIAAQCGSFAILGQKSEILEVGENFLEWKPLDDAEWSLDKKIILN